MVNLKEEEVTQTKYPLEMKSVDFLCKSSLIFSIGTMIMVSRPMDGHVVRQVQVDFGDKGAHDLKSELS